MTNKDDKKVLKEMWKDPQKKALIKLGLWLAFFIIIFLFLWIASLFSKNDSTKNLNQSDKQEEKVEANIPKLLEKLINSDYGFEIKITNNDVIEIINGTVKSKITTGYYEKENNIIKFYYQDQNYYQLVENEKILNNDLISEEYRKNIDLNYILENIKNFENSGTALIENNVYSYYINDFYNIKIQTKENNIEKISIMCNNISYEISVSLIL